MPIANLIDWCKLARDEDSKNVLYANFKYEIDGKHIESGILKQFDEQIGKFQTVMPPDATAIDYLNAASKAADLFYKGKALSIPIEGVARVITIQSFEREYKSFLTGATNGPDNAQNLYEKLRTEESNDSIEQFVNAINGQNIAEDFAKKHTGTLQTAYESEGKELPATLTAFQNINENRVTWVTKAQELEAILNSPSSNLASLICNKLGLIYSEFPLAIVLIKYNAIDGDVILYKPTIFSLGYEDAYCADGGNGGWGCTAELETGEPGLPEAVAPRKNFKLIDSQPLGIIDSSMQSNNDRISERLGHDKNNPYNCSSSLCKRMSNI